jgi:hypothetical protein
MLLSEKGLSQYKRAKWCVLDLNQGACADTTRSCHVVLLSPDPMLEEQVARGTQAHTSSDKLERAFLIFRGPRLFARMHVRLMNGRRDRDGREWEV